MKILKLDWSGLKLWLRQLGSMLYKNRLVLQRNWRLTIALFLSPIIFISVLVLIDSASSNEDTLPIYNINENYHHFDNLKLSKKLTKCVSFNGVLCKTLRYAMDPTVKSTDAEKIINEVMSESDLSFSDDVQHHLNLTDFIEKNPNSTTLGVLFHSLSNKGFSYTVFFNSTYKYRRLLFPSIVRDDRLILQWLLDRSYMKVFGNSNINLDVSMQEYPYIHQEKSGTSNSFRRYSSTFYYANMMFIYVFILIYICQEKEQMLRQGLKMFGLKDSVYWMSWFITGTIIGCIMTLLNLIMGYIYSITYFNSTLFFINFLIFFTFAESILVMAFLTSTFIGKSKSAITIGILVFILGSVFVTMTGERFVLVAMYDRSKVSGPLISFFSLFPPFNFGKSVADINFYLNPDITEKSAESGNYYYWKEFFRGHKVVRYTVPPDVYETVLPSPSSSIVYCWMDFAIFCILTWYFDNIVKSTNGNPYKWYYPFLYSYWRSYFAEVTNVKSSKLSKENSQGANKNEIIKVDSISKTFGRKNGLHCLYPSHMEPINAVQNVSFQVNESEIYCLLGPNGAGKSAIMSILSGILEPDSGDGTILGHSIVSDIDRVRQFIGVCPQNDILWGELTASEHIIIFATIKNIPKDQIKLVVKDTLQFLGLQENCDNKLVSTYSGGMKRRLGVGIAYIGDSKVILLDEPTAGMDPLMRNQIWKMILSKLENRTVVMTTHTVDEAEILASTLAIIQEGKIISEGTPLSLKNRYSGYIIDVFSESKSLKEIITDCCKIIPSIQDDSDFDNLITISTDTRYCIRLDPSISEYLIPLVSALENFSVDFGITQIPLDEAFLRITNCEY